MINQIDTDLQTIDQLLAQDEDYSRWLTNPNAFYRGHGYYQYLAGQRLSKYRAMYAEQVAQIRAGGALQSIGDHAMKYQFNDGGRAGAGYKGDAGDCVTRAIAIATQTPYQQVYDAINQLAKQERPGKRKRGKSSARSGVHKDLYKQYLTSIGWTYTATMGIGTGCTVHLRDGELPQGRLIVSVSKHLTAVIDGIIHDTFDPSREGSRCVYGYWRRIVND